MVPLDVHDVRVPGERVEGPVALRLDEVHGGFPAQQGKRVVHPRLVGVGSGVGEHEPGLLGGEGEGHENFLGLSDDAARW